MNVEFLINEALGNGTQLFIPANEFLKAYNDRNEFDSFRLATECYFSRFGLNAYFGIKEYNTIKPHVDKNGAVIITVIEERYPIRIIAEVYVSNNNKLKKIDI